MITNVRVTPLTNSKGNTKAFGKFTLSEVVEVSFSVVQGREGLFVSLPSHKGKDKEGADKWYNDVYVTDETLRKDLQKKCLDVYKAQTGGQGEGAGPDNQEVPSDW